MNWNKIQKNKLRIIRVKLLKIDTILDEIDYLDPYGDIVQNFEDECRERQTKRLISMITEDLRI